MVLARDLQMCQWVVEIYICWGLVMNYCVSTQEKGIVMEPNFYILSSGYCGPIRFRLCKGYSFKEEWNWN